MLNSELKDAIKTFCLDLLQQKALALHSAIKAANESANNETKSSAGDKHETARAMMQLEQEKLNKQLKELNDQQEELVKINTSQIHHSITKGSLIKTPQALIYIASGIGKIHVNGQTVFVVSEQSPLGKKLMGARSGDKIELNGTSYSIEEIH
jgi:transcription elongation GreA/GreB family factor